MEVGGGGVSESLRVGEFADGTLNSSHTQQQHSRSTSYSVLYKISFSYDTMYYIVS